MSDYPCHAKDKSVSQAWHAEKMLKDSPSPPTVRVNGTIYFTDELLRLSNGTLFIPDRFFYETFTSDTGKDITSQPMGELLALGHTVTVSEVSKHIT